MKYQVFDTDVQADTDAPNSSLSKGYGWDNSIFDTLKEAVEYMFKWIEPYGVGEEKKEIKPNITYPYYGNEFWMEIREIE